MDSSPSSSKGPSPKKPVPAKKAPPLPGRSTRKGRGSADAPAAAQDDEEAYDMAISDAKPGKKLTKKELAALEAAEHVKAAQDSHGGDVPETLAVPPTSLVPPVAPEAPEGHGETKV